MVHLSWKLDDAVDQTLIKGYRVILNSRPTEILPPNQHEYELRNLRPGLYFFSPNNGKQNNFFSRYNK